MSLDPSSTLLPYNATDPYATFINASCMDLLLIELVPMAYRLAGDFSSSASTAKNNDVNGGASAGTGAGAGDVLDEDEKREVARRKLEMLGYRVGQGLAER